MEIGYIFEEFARHNYLIGFGGGKPVEVLHAIKAVSDTGDEKQRGDNKPVAMAHAAQVAIAYLGFLFSKCLLEGTPIDQGGAIHHVPVVQPPNQVNVDDTKTLHDISVLDRALIAGALAKKPKWDLLGGAFKDELKVEWTRQALLAVTNQYANDDVLAQRLIDEFEQRLLKISSFRRGLQKLGLDSIITDFPVLQ
jgi:hypothetical protein